MNNNEAVGRIRFMLDVGGSDGFTSADKEALNMAINALSKESSAQPKTNGDKARDSLSKLSDYKIAHLIDFCGLYDECEDCPMNGMKKCGGSTPTVKQLWLKQEVSEDDGSKTD